MVTGCEDRWLYVLLRNLSGESELLAFHVNSSAFEI